MVTLINPQREEYASPFGEKSSMFNSCFLRLASRNSKQRTQKISHRLLSNRDSDYFSRSMSIIREPDCLSNSFSSSGVAASFKKELANAAKLSFTFRLISQISCHCNTRPAIHSLSLRKKRSSKHFHRNLNFEPIQQRLMDPKEIKTSFQLLNTLRVSPSRKPQQK